MKFAVDWIHFIFFQSFNCNWAHLLHNTHWDERMNNACLKEKAGTIMTRRVGLREGLISLCCFYKRSKLIFNIYCCFSFSFNTLYDVHYNLISWISNKFKRKKCLWQNDWTEFPTKKNYLWQSDWNLRLKIIRFKNWKSWGGIKINFTQVKIVGGNSPHSPPGFTPMVLASPLTI